MHYKLNQVLQDVKSLINFDTSTSQYHPTDITRATRKVSENDIKEHIRNCKMAVLLETQELEILVFDVNTLLYTLKNKMYKQFIHYKIGTWKTNVLFGLPLKYSQTTHYCLVSDTYKQMQVLSSVIML